MEENPNETNSYSRVIFKNYNDQEAKDILNSYKYKSSSPGKFKKWSPDLAFEERYKKKRSREDRYIQNFHPNERPVLVIKKKHEYKGLENPNLIQDTADKESYYKISENTYVVDDITREIQEMENFIRRHTFIHKMKNTPQDTEGLSSVYKVEGKEFLPEGFIELDPLLLKDEYEFESKEDERLFWEEQRKMKMLRRKQYEQRNDKKMRDVTIFVIDEKKNKVIDFLDRWVIKNKRKMNKGELEYVSTILNVNPEQLNHLQELYFKKQDIIRNHPLVLNKGNQEEALKNFPQGIQNQFKKSDYDQVDSKYMKQQEPYIPSFLNKYEKKIKKLPSYNLKKKEIQEQDAPLIDTKELDRTLVKTLGENQQNDLKEKLNQKQLSKTQPGEEEDRTLIEIKKLTGNPNIETDLQKYFDQEINSILDKLKDTDYKKQLQKKEEESLRESQKYIERYKEKILQSEDSLKNIPQENDDKLQKKDQTQQQRKETAQQQRKETAQQQRKNSAQKEKKEPNQQQRKVSAQKEKKEPNQQQRKESAQKEKIVPKQKQPTISEKKENQLLPKRFSVIGKKEGEIFIQQKLSPVLIGNEYYFQTIEDTRPENDQKKVFLFTRNDQGQLISEYEIPEQKQGNFYTNEVIDIPPSFIGDQSKKLKVKNEKGEEVHTQIIRPSVALLFSDVLEEDLKISNFKKPIIEEADNIKTHKLAPVIFNNKEYRQVVQEMNFPEENMQQINVITYNDNSQIVGNKKIQPHLKGSSYYSIIESKTKEQENFEIQTRNNFGEIASIFDLDQEQNDEHLNSVIVEEKEQMKIIKLNPLAIGERLLKQEIELDPNDENAKIKTINDFEEVIDEQIIPASLITEKCFSEISKQNEKPVLLTKNQNKEIIGEFSIPKEYIKQQDLNFDSVQQINDNQGNLRASIQLKTTPNQTFRNYSLRPTLIGNKYYYQTINELMDKKNNTPKAVLITSDENGNILGSQQINPKLLSDDYYNQVVNETIDGLGNRKATLQTYNNQNQLINSQEVQNALTGKFANNYYDQILEELVNDQKENEEAQILALQKMDDGEYEVNRDVTEILKPKSKQEKFDYYNELLDKYGQKRRRSFEKENPDEFRDKAKTWAKFPENYKFPQEDKEIDDEVKEQINQALEDVELIQKMEPEEIQSFKEIQRMESQKGMQEVPVENQNQEELQGEIEKEILNRSNGKSNEKKQNKEEQSPEEHSHQKKHSHDHSHKKFSQQLNTDKLRPRCQTCFQNEQEKDKQMTFDKLVDKVKDLNEKRRKSQSPEIQKEQEESKKKSLIQEKQPKKSLIQEIYGDVLFPKEEIKQNQNALEKEQQPRQSNQNQMVLKQRESQQNVKDRISQNNQEKRDSQNIRKSDQKNSDQKLENQKNEEEQPRNSMNEDRKRSRQYSQKDDQNIKKNSSSKLENFNSFQNQDEIQPSMDKTESEDRSFKSFEPQNEIKENLKKVFERESKQMTPELLQKLKDETGAQSTEELIDDFYYFCINLKKDEKYKEEGN